MAFEYASVYVHVCGACLHVCVLCMCVWRVCVTEKRKAYMYVSVCKYNE